MSLSIYLSIYLSIMCVYLRRTFIYNCVVFFEIIARYICCTCSSFLVILSICLISARRLLKYSMIEGMPMCFILQSFSHFNYISSGVECVEILVLWIICNCYISQSQQSKQQLEFQGKEYYGIIGPGTC